MNKDFQSFIKGLDPKVLSEGIKKAQEFAKTEKGKEIINKIKSGEKVEGVNREEIAKAFSQNPEIIEKINDMMK